jgi:hypothetical protein
VGIGIQSANLSKQVLTGPAEASSLSPVVQAQALPKATQFSQDATKSATNCSVGVNGKEKNVTAVGNTPVSLKRTRGSEEDRDVDKVQENAATTSAIFDEGQQPRKKVKSERDSEMESIPPTPSLSRFSSETSFISSTIAHAAGSENHTPVDADTRSKVDYGDLYGTQVYSSILKDLNALLQVKVSRREDARGSKS